MKTKQALLIATLALGTLLSYAADKKDTGVPASYPLKKCVISDEELGGMGKPFKVTHDGTDVYLCCKSCLKDFNKDPAKYVKRVKDAAAKE